MTAPADRLREAAAKVRETAEDASPGPWMALEVDRQGFVLDADEQSEDERLRVVVCGTHLPAERHGSMRLPGTYEPQHLLIEAETGQIEDGQEAEHWASMRWIALASPALAEPLAAWLEQSAASLEVHLPEWRPRRSEGDLESLVAHHHGPALALADVILGGVS